MSHAKVLAVAALTCLIACAGVELEHDRQPPAGDEAPIASDDDALRTAARCPDCRVLSKATLSLPETGVLATSAKLEGDGWAGIVTLLPDGRQVEAEELVQKEHEARFARYGKLSPALHERLHGAADGEKLRVGIWTTMEVPEAPSEEMSETAKQKFDEHARGRAREASGPVLAALHRAGAKIERDGSDSPLIVAELPANEIEALAQEPQVAGVDVHMEPVAQFAPSDQLYRSTTYSSPAQMISTGAGSKVCLFDIGIPDDTSQLEIAATINPSCWKETHARWTTGVIRNKQGTSMAPGAALYTATTTDACKAADGSLAETWCYNQGTQIVSVSMAQSMDAQGRRMYQDELTDYQVKVRRMLWVTAAGNWGNPTDPISMQYVANKPYNALLVGGASQNQSSNLATTADDTVWIHSWRNPTIAYNDYELPHLMAPADTAALVGTSGNATSIATPQTSAVAAMMRTRDGLFWRPELTKAVLIATATNRLDAGIMTQLPPGPHLRDGVDQKAGAGLLNAEFAVKLAGPQEYGWNYGPMPMSRWATTATFATDFAQQPGTCTGCPPYLWNYSFRTGTISQAGLRGRVVLVWTAKSTVCYANGTVCSKPPADLDLRVRDETDGTIVNTSATYDGTWEMVDFPIKPGHSYKYEVLKWSSHPDDTRTEVGIAWVTYDGRLATGPENLFGSAAPTGGVVGSGSAVELGVKLRSATPGKITAIRAYRTAGYHPATTVTLWSDTGVALATQTMPAASFTSGDWQTVNLSQPVTITPGVTYVASYFANDGAYAYAGSYFNSDVVAGSLTAPSSASSGGNGVYRYGATSGFPTSTYSSANYWVDVDFVPTQKPQSIFASPMQSVATGSDSPAEVGVKFKSSVAGRITGIRVHRPANAVATTVRLWSSTGTVLASASLPGGGAAGWKVASLSAPVAVTPGTIYIASYHQGGTTYSQCGATGTLTVDAVNGYLTAPKNGTAGVGGNGVYAYGPAGTFPVNTYYGYHYMADVEFQPD